MKMLSSQRYITVLMLAPLLLLTACSTVSTPRNTVNQTPTRSVAPGVVNTRALAAGAGHTLSAGVPNQLTELHNRWRTPLGIQPLSWSEHLASSAQQWANRLQQQGCRLSHETTSPYGENLAAGTNLTAAAAVGLWGDESAYYNGQNNQCMSGQVCGHYTQMVWRNTRELGCGVAYCRQFAVWVCRYNPPGNVRGYRPY